MKEPENYMAKFDAKYFDIQSEALEDSSVDIGEDLDDETYVRFADGSMTSAEEATMRARSDNSVVIDSIADEFVEAYNLLRGLVRGWFGWRGVLLDSFGLLQSRSWTVAWNQVFEEYGEMVERTLGDAWKAHLQRCPRTRKRREFIQMITLESLRRGPKLTRLNMAYAGAFFLVLGMRLPGQAQVTGETRASKGVSVADNPAQLIEELPKALLLNPDEKDPQGFYHFKILEFRQLVKKNPEVPDFKVTLGRLLVEAGKIANDPQLIREGQRYLHNAIQALENLK